MLSELNFSCVASRNLLMQSLVAFSIMLKLSASASILYFARFELSRLSYSPTTKLAV